MAVRKMRRARLRDIKRWLLGSAALIALPFAVGACGGSTGRTGGTLTVINSADFQHADPGAAYYQFDYMVDYATQRPLYSFKPGQTAEPPSPDLASGPWRVSKDARTVTVHIKRGIRFSPPVSREVTAADVKYALERGFSQNVANAYVAAYFPIAGAPAQPTAGVKPISGITTPDRYTIQIRLTKPTGLTAAEALALPLSAPVPREYAARFDRKNPSTYASHQVATGPYMIQNDKAGNTVGYVPGRSITIVRNPNWNRTTDFRPAKLNRIVVQEGFTDTNAATRKVLQGSREVTGDFAVPSAALQLALTQFKSQTRSVWSGAYHAVMLNTTKAPFNDLNVRKAVVAGLDKTALRQARGGPADGALAYHFIPAHFPGYEEAGGASSPYDFMASPKANMAVAAKYFRAAGFKRGRYGGQHKNIAFVCDSTSPELEVCLVAAADFRALGFNPQIQQVAHGDEIAICGTLKKEPQVCPNFGWGKDFYDPQPLLDTPFNGARIIPQNNNNWSQLKNPAIDAAFAKAATLNDIAARDRAYGAIDRMISAQAPAAPFVGERQTSAEAKDVDGVVSNFVDTWDLSYTALK
jgi:peptide/nickel transport system substrate-binding protein